MAPATVDERREEAIRLTEKMLPLPLPGDAELAEEALHALLLKLAAQLDPKFKVEVDTEDVTSLSGRGRRATSVVAYLLARTGALGWARSSREKIDIGAEKAKKAILQARQRRRSK